MIEKSLIKRLKIILAQVLIEWFKDEVKKTQEKSPTEEGEGGEQSDG